MAKGKLDLYALGQGGVNVVKAPIQLKDDECTSAQNATYAPAAAGGLQKRGGLARQNATALNSGADVLAIASVPLPNPFNTSTLPRAYIYLNGGPLNDWVRSADGATWEGIDAPGPAEVEQMDGIPDIGLATVQPVPGLLLYLSSLNIFSAYDGSSDQVVLTVPSTVSPSVALECYAGIGYHAGHFYFGVKDDGVNYGTVFKFDITTGQLTMVVGTLGGYSALAICSYLGQLFVAGSDMSSGAAPNCFIFRCEPATATAWVTDSANLGGPICSMVNFKGNLYMASGSLNAAVALTITKRTPSGVYSTVFTDATPWDVQTGGAMIEFNDTLFAYMGGKVVKSTDGTAWSTDLDVFATYGSLQYVSGLPVIFNGELYWAFREFTGTEDNSRILKRTTGGVWSVVYAPGANISSASLTVFEVP